jgi:cobalt-zinc-cadmium efflux system protein
MSEPHDHGHGHPEHGPHVHHHHADAGPRLIWALLLTLGFAAVEAVTGFWSGSLALLGDAGHMVTDSASLALAAFAAWISKRPPTQRHTYGYGRVETLAALANVLFMVVVVVGISVMAVRRILEPGVVNGEAVTIVAALGLLLNIGVAWLLMHGEQTMNTRGALLHVLGDLLGSVAALVSGAVIMWTGWMTVDPLLSLLICALMLVSSLRLLREVLQALMEGVPVSLSTEEVGRRAGRRAGRGLGARSAHLDPVVEPYRAVGASGRRIAGALAGGPCRQSAGPRRAGHHARHAAAGTSAQCGSAGCRARRKTRRAGKLSRDAGRRPARRVGTGRSRWSSDRQHRRRSAGPGRLRALSDADADLDWMAAKLARLRIFADAAGVMNRSVVDADGEMLAVSQFTLFASTRKGNRPSWNRAAPPHIAGPLFDRFVLGLESVLGRSVPTGVFAPTCGSTW